jgi:hypothetical protein
VSLASYAALKASVANWINRADLVAEIPDFIRLAEVSLGRRLKCREMTQLDTITISGESKDLPCDFAGVESFRLNTDPVRALEFRNVEEFDDVLDDAGCGPGMPSLYTIAGGKFYFSPTPDGEYQARLRYRSRLPKLSENGTNWLLDEHPDAYLYGALAQTAPFLKDDDRLPMWLARFDQIIAEINLDGSRQAVGGRPAARVKRIG